MPTPVRSACNLNTCTFHQPSPSSLLVFKNTSHKSAHFLKAARIQPGSEEHMDLLNTIRTLYHKYLNPSKYMHEQSPQQVEKLVAKAKLTLPWLNNYEDAWPARVYLHRYTDGRRPYRKRGCKPHNSNKQFVAERNQALFVKDFLGSLNPSLEHHLDAFAELGVKDQETIHAFLSRPESMQAQLLDEARAVLPLTRLERQGLLLGCVMWTQRALQNVDMDKATRFYL